MAENMFELFSHKKAVGDDTERAEGHRVVDEVGNFHAFRHCFESVTMEPKLVRTKSLFINKRLPFVDCFDFGDPTHVDPGGNFDPIGDDLPFIEAVAGKVLNLEAHVIGSDFVEISGI